METRLEIRVGEMLRKRGLRLAAAESCTGGLVGHLITNVPGSSTYYMGSVTAYAYEAKVRLLGVKWETLEAHGAVSDPVVKEMADGVRRALAADIGISISGIAGPSGGTPEKPVGLVWFSWAEKQETGEHHIWSTHHVFAGDREAVRRQAVATALKGMLDGIGKA